MRFPRVRLTNEANQHQKHNQQNMITEQNNSHPVIVREGCDEVFGDGLGSAQLCDTHGVAMIHNNHHILSLWLDGVQEDIPAKRTCTITSLTMRGANLILGRK